MDTPTTTTATLITPEEQRSPKGKSLRKKRTGGAGNQPREASDALLEPPAARKKKEKETLLAYARLHAARIARNPGSKAILRSGSILSAGMDTAAQIPAAGDSPAQEGADKAPEPAVAESGDKAPETAVAESGEVAVDEPVVLLAEDPEVLPATKEELEQALLAERAKTKALEQGKKAAKSYREMLAMPRTRPRFHVLTTPAELDSAKKALAKQKAEAYYAAKAQAAALMESQKELDASKHLLNAARQDAAVDRSLQQLRATSATSALAQAQAALTQAQAQAAQEVADAKAAAARKVLDAEAALQTARDLIADVPSKVADSIAAKVKETVPAAVKQGMTSWLDKENLGDLMTKILDSVDTEATESATDRLTLHLLCKVLSMSIADEESPEAKALLDQLEDPQMYEDGWHADEAIEHQRILAGGGSEAAKLLHKAATAASSEEEEEGEAGEEPAAKKPKGPKTTPATYATGGKEPRLKPSAAAATAAAAAVKAPARSATPSEVAAKLPKKLPKGQQEGGGSGITPAEKEAELAAELAAKRPRFNLTAPPPKAKSPKAKAATGVRQAASEWPQDPKRWMEPQVRWQVLEGFNAPDHDYPFADKATTEKLELSVAAYAKQASAAEVGHMKALIRKAFIYWRFLARRKGVGYESVPPTAETIENLINDQTFCDSTTCWDEDTWWVQNEVRGSTGGGPKHKSRVARVLHDEDSSEPPSDPSDSDRETTPPRELTPLEHRGRDDRERKRDVDFRKEMAAMRPRLHDSAKTAQVERWETDVREYANLHYGHTWEHLDCVVYGIVKSFSDDLLDMYRADHKHGTPPLHWAELRTWVLNHVDREIRNREQDAIQSLIAGDVTQGERTVHKYFNNFRRAMQYLPNMPEQQKIVFFTRGLSSTIRPFCMVNEKGKPWTDFDALLDFAVAKEITMQSEARTQSQMSALLRPPKRLRNFTDRASKKRTREPSLNAQVVPRSAKEAKAKAAPREEAAGGRGRGLGGRGGRGDAANGGRGGAGRGRGSEKLEVRGNPRDPWHTNPQISNEQAKFLLDRGLCWSCYDTLTTCRTKRANPKRCRQDGQQVPLTNQVEGAPKWE